jgi:hypothetical protein
MRGFVWAIIRHVHKLPEMLFLGFSPRIQHFEGKLSIWVRRPRLFPKEISPLTTQEVKSLFLIIVSPAYPS